MTTSKTYKDSPFGIAGYQHVHQPDAKFNPAAPVFKSDILFGGPVAQKLKAEVDEAAQAAFDAYFGEGGKGEGATPGERKKWSVYYPYEVLEDAEGNPTGDIEFHFRQNATIKLKDGTVKEIKLGVYDASGTKAVTKPVFRGSEIRARYSKRPITMTSNKQVGVRLDFAAIQVRKLSEGGQKEEGFGAVEGYEEGGFAPSGPVGSEQSGQADY